MDPKIKKNEGKGPKRKNNEGTDPEIKEMKVQIIKSEI